MINKRGNTFDILLIVVTIFAVAILANLVFTSISRSEQSILGVTNKPLDESLSTGTQNHIESELGGELGPVIIRKIDTIIEDDAIIIEKPTSPDYCLVMTSLRNTGKKKWTDADKIRVSLFCKDLKNSKITVKNYQARGYVKDLEQGKSLDLITFASKFPNTCVKSDEKYQIILYSNCEGDGTELQPCDNFVADRSKNPVILSKVEFNCK